MPRKTSAAVKDIEQYTHADKERVNNPQVGLVTPETDKESGQQTYAYDPHLDPQLQWAGKAEHTSFAVPTVSLHVHERIDPRTIIEAVRRKHEEETGFQFSLFDSDKARLPFYQEIEFYKHKHNWSNRLIAGDSTLVMNSLLVKEGMAGSVQMIYFDPPYGIKYGSNFQPFVNKRDVKDGKDEDLTSEPETLKAFRDTWELGIHSYLTYLRDRLLLARELLADSGSLFVQISDENVHLVRNLMDEVFGVENFIGMISFQKKGSQSGDFIPSIHEYIIWYAKDKVAASGKFHRLYEERNLSGAGGSGFDSIELANGEVRRLLPEEQSGKKEFPNGARVFSLNPLFSQKSGPNTQVQIEGKLYPSGGNSWKVSPNSIPNLHKLGRAVVTGNRLRFKRYADDFNWIALSNVWTGLAGATDKVYVVQTNPKVVERCLLMTTDPGDLVLDITCGSGTTAFVAEQWGRRWMTCDTSRVALALARQRLMTATFDYYQLANATEGVASGFKYKTVPHITLKSIANNEPPATETLYDQPLTVKNTARVTSPFTVEAVPAPVVQALEFRVSPLGESVADEEPPKGGTLNLPADNSLARSGESLRQDEWRGELLRAGIRGRRGEKMQFSRVEPLSGTRFLHADAELAREDGSEPARAVVSFGPEHEPMPPAQIELALQEANRLFPKPKFVIFAAFQFDPVAVNNIEQTNWPGVQLLKVQMNADLLTDDLKKNRSSNESFWLIGQPDVQLKKLADGNYQVEVLGFDYYNVKEGLIESGGAHRIAVWLLDTNFDGRSLFPQQVFFPLSGDKEGWTRLAKNLKAEIDQELIESYHGSVSLPFKAGNYQRIAVKIVDDRGIESLKLIDVV